ncbi:TPA: DoxX family protein [Candidatus Woesearchaeota archaeon]|nr:DoxX family protein [Candidatus Woesearchaeota archaeon]HII66243.1 DoxX family protein [Candidatus Woesearchaeota archaeon]
MKRLKENLRKDPVAPLRIGLGLVFLLAGIHRIVFFGLAVQNFTDVGLRPAPALVVLAIIAELIAGILFLLNRRMVQACLLIMAVMLAGIFASVIRAGTSLWQNINEVFMLTYTPTDIVLHISYVIGILTVLLWAMGGGKGK